MKFSSLHIHIAWLGLFLLAAVPIAAEAPRAGEATPELSRPVRRAEPGFEIQPLSPTFGEVLRPTGWFYTEGHRSPTNLRWIISKENADGHPYETGMSIQLFLGVSQKMNKPADAVVRELAEKQRAGLIGAKSCDSSSQGEFQRICLEGEESRTVDGKAKRYHILYSLFYSNSLDMAAFVVSGAPAELWEMYVQDFEKMRSMKLLDMKKLSEAASGKK